MNANIAGFLRESAERHPDATCVVAGGRRAHVVDIDRAVDAFAAGLLQRGLHAGDRIAILLGNCVEFVVAYYGAARAGLVSVPLNPAYTSAEVAVLLADSGARMLIVQPSTQQVGEESSARAAGLRGRQHGGEEWARDRDRSGEGAVLAEVATSPDALALLLFTAGTSGRPKGAMLTHGALRANIEMLLALTDPPAVVDDDVVLVVLPMFHVYGLNTALGLAVAAGATCVLSDRFDPVESLQLITRWRRHDDRRRPGDVPGVVRDPGAARGDVDRAHALERRLAAAGPRCSTSFAELTGLRIFEGYGMTETAPVVATTLVSGTPEGRVGGPPAARPRRPARRRGRQPRSTRAIRARCGCAGRRCSGLLARRCRRSRRRAAGSGPATSPTPTRTATCTWSTGAARSSSSTASTSTRGRSSWSSTTSRGSRRRPSWASRTTRPGRPSRPSWSPRRGATLTAGADRRALRDPAGPVQVPDVDPRRRDAAALGDRQGRQGPAARRVRGHRVRRREPPRSPSSGSPDCHLCDEARTVIAEVCAETGDDVGGTVDRGRSGALRRVLGADPGRARRRAPARLLADRREPPARGPGPSGHPITGRGRPVNFVTSFASA